ncbi:MAG: nitrogen fixation protein NifB [Fusobacteriaceae bacterium]|jgi:MoaA/NifB/PqqE/SkfB family radical SAM enzyme|nr:nitrogenase cofactor biosynthesis protein NifB [Fusobacteriales bacterium]MDN5304066.1 nitrogen fixation protein NifB [Fusobacteriaceae bacterium]
MGCVDYIDNSFYENMSNREMELIKEHPCYNFKAHNNARMHIPIAPKCNIQCNYCNRKYDCVNESRPGVTSEVLTTREAIEKIEFVKQKIQNLSVIGIAGPGDALANWENTKEVVKLIKEKYPNITICLSTNGLMLDKYKEEIIKLGIKHITITINSIDKTVGSKIYEFVKYEDKIYKGEEGAEILQENQFKGLKYLSENGVLCKINIVLIKGINDEHIKEVVDKVKEYGAFMTNIMPLIPAKGTRFEDNPLVSKKELDKIRKECSLDLRQMFHCQQCRADAIGKLTEDKSLEFKDFTRKKTERIRFAIASKDNKLINQHFGHVDRFYIYEYSNDKIKFVEERGIEKYCSGKENCDDKIPKMDLIKDIVKDCKALLCVRIGYVPKKTLRKNGIEIFETYDLIEEGIKKIVNKID